VGPGAGGRRGTPRAAWEAPGAEEGEQMRSAAGGCRAEFRNLNTPVIILIFLSSKIKRNQPSFSTFRESDPLLSSSSSSGKKNVSFSFVFPVEKFTGLCHGDATSSVICQNASVVYFF
jgi:hypothetical protein